jgi:hypothetical protein
MVAAVLSLSDFGRRDRALHPLGVGADRYALSPFFSSSDE